MMGPLSTGTRAGGVDVKKFPHLPGDVVFGAALFRHYKPDPETYLGACDFLGLRPEQVMMGAAHNYDLKAAKALGLRTAFIPRATEYGPGQKTDLTAEDAWDIVAVDLVDLAGKLAA